MSSPGLTLVTMTLVLAALIGLLIFVVIRLRTSAGRGRTRAREVSEEAFMATAIQEALAGRGGAATSTAAAPRAASIDTTIVNGLPIGVLVVRKGGIVARGNASAFHLLQMTAAPALPARLVDLTAPSALVETVERVLGNPQAAELRLETRADGRVSQVVGAAVSPMPIETGTPAGVLVVLTDLTDTERQQRLVRRRETMAATARLASGLAHELANNLTGAHGYSRMIDSSTLSPADRASLEALQRETDALGETIDGFRRVTRPLELTRERFPVRWLVEDAARHVIGELNAAPDAIATRTPESLEIDGDRILLEEALMHVLRNAIEASVEAGLKPEVRVSARALLPGDAVAVVVEDNGPGMPPAEQARLFEPFFSTRAGRAGLGLARARHILHSHDGTIEMSSRDGRGLTVTMVIPVADPSHTPSGAR